MTIFRTIGFGGGCHWCTEAVFQHVKGVTKVEQGYIASTGTNAPFSEGVIVHYNTTIVSLEILIEIHLDSHASTTNHSMRDRYRSAIYYMDLKTKDIAQIALEKLQQENDKNYITKVLSFQSFKASRESIRDYYKKNPNAPFCTRYILPKLKEMNVDYLSKAPITSYKLS